MARCEECIHSRVCVIRGFPSAFENTHWEKEPCDHFKAADVAPRAEVAREIFWEMDMLLMSITIDEEAEESFVGLDFDKYLAIRRKHTKVEMEMPKGDAS